MDVGNTVRIRCLYDTDLPRTAVGAAGTGRLEATPILLRAGKPRFLGKVFRFLKVFKGFSIFWCTKKTVHKIATQEEHSPL